MRHGVAAQRRVPRWTTRPPCCSSEMASGPGQPPSPDMRFAHGAVQSTARPSSTPRPAWALALERPGRPTATSTRKAQSGISHATHRGGVPSVTAERRCAHLVLLDHVDHAHRGSVAVRPTLSTPHPCWIRAAALHDRIRLRAHWGQPVAYRGFRGAVHPAHGGRRREIPAGRRPLLRPDRATAGRRLQRQAAVPGVDGGAGRLHSRQRLRRSGPPAAHRLSPYNNQMLSWYCWRSGRPGQNGSQDWSGLRQRCPGQPSGDGVTAAKSTTATEEHTQAGHRVLWDNMVALPLFDGSPATLVWSRTIGGVLQTPRSDSACCGTRSSGPCASPNRPTTPRPHYLVNDHFGRSGALVKHALRSLDALRSSTPVGVAE